MFPPQRNLVSLKQNKKTSEIFAIIPTIGFPCLIQNLFFPQDNSPLNKQKIFSLASPSRGVFKMWMVLHTDLFQEMELLPEIGENAWVELAKEHQQAHTIGKI